MITPAEEAGVLRKAAVDVMTLGWPYGRVWRLCAAAWLISRADRLSPKKGKKKA